jgi:hypothetical protein
MADKKISALPAATTPLAGTEVLPIVQSGVTDKVSVANLTAGRDVAVNKLNATDNVVIGTAGKGVDFTANGGDVLTQYDEGTWTPVFTGSSSNPTVTYGLQRGKYTRVGNQVTATFFITWTAFSGGAGELNISLPFAGESATGVYGAGVLSSLTGITFAAGRTFLTVRPQSGVAKAIFPQSGSGVSSANTAVGDVAASGQIIASMTYII